MKHVLLSTLFVALAAGGCASTPHAPPSLTGTTWQLERIEGHDSIGSKASLTVSREGRMGGNGSCNAMFGHATVEGHKISFGAIGSTKMACTDSDIMDQERHYFDALKQVVSWRIDDGRLYLTDRAHKDVLVYEPD